MHTCTRFSAALVGLALMIAAAFPALAEVKEYRIDPTHTRVIFFISHTGYSYMVGAVHGVSGTFRFDADKPEQGAVDVTLDPKTIDTFHEGLNKHLQNADFFDTARYPEMRFNADRVTPTGKNTGTITGNLTMHGVTKPVTLKVTLNKNARHPITNNLTAGFSAETTLKRSDFGISYGAPDLIGDEVRVLIEMEGDNATADKEKPKHT